MRLTVLDVLNAPTCDPCDTGAHERCVGARVCGCPGCDEHRADAQAEMLADDRRTGVDA